MLVVRVWGRTARSVLDFVGLFCDASADTLFVSVAECEDECEDECEGE